MTTDDDIRYEPVADINLLLAEAIKDMLAKPGFKEPVIN
jgi:hypothetical protein